jgi:hypothetical protein
MAVDGPRDMCDADPFEIVSLIGVGDGLTLREAIRHVLSQDAVIAGTATILRGGYKQPEIFNRLDIDILARRPEFRIVRFGPAR